MKQRLTITLDDETLELMKEIAEERNLTLKQLGEELLLMLVERYKKAKKIATTK